MNTIADAKEKSPCGDLPLFYATLVDGKIDQNGIYVGNVAAEVKGLADKYPGRRITFQPCTEYLEQAKIIPLELAPEKVIERPIEVVLDVEDFNPDGDSDTPEFGVVRVDATLMARIAELRSVAIAVGCSELRTWHSVDWQNDPGVDCEELVVTQSSVAFHALHKGGSFGFATRLQGIDEFFALVAQAEPGSSMTWGSQEVKDVWDEHQADDEVDDDAHAPGAAG